MGTPRYSWQFCLHVVLLILLLLPYYILLSFAATTISSNHQLSGNQTLTSKEGKFEFGFFSPGKSKNYYLGIWFKKVSYKSVVWVANRETPLSDPSSSITKIADNGNLVILENQNKSAVPIWSTNSSSITSNLTVVEILDSGNLVLRDGSNSSAVFWQSFDHPTDTWLPGAKVGRNLVTGEYTVLVSWKNSEDPSSGIFSLQMDPSGSNQYFIRWNRSRTYWTSGKWNGQFFTEVPEMKANYLFSFAFVVNDMENYFIYSMQDSSIITKFVMDVSGRIQQLIWSEGDGKWTLLWSEPMTQCKVYSACGPFGSCDDKRSLPCSCLSGFSEASPKSWDLGDLSGGCVRDVPLQCEISSNISSGGHLDEFKPMLNMRFPDDPEIHTVSNIEECKSICLKNCSCAAYSFGKECKLWYGSLVNVHQLSEGGSDGTLFLRIAASGQQNSRIWKGIVKWVILGVLVGCFVLFLALLLLFFMYRERKFRKLQVLEGTLVAFSSKDLRRVTKNFSEKLGGGGFGNVFKGTMPDSTDIAVKKLESISQGEKQFRSEVSTIGTIQHVNLVRLRGFCSEGTKRLLVYDYMPNGSLDAIFRGKSSMLDWNTRYRIALGTARGLAYLHEGCRDCIIHCDIKPENILLDTSFVPKVADFGLAKLVGRDFSRVLTTFRGTRGYLAPEWLLGMPITSKADVYSYGMMLFEIISGKRNSELLNEEGTSGFFPSFAYDKMMEDDLLCVLDPRLEGNTILKELEQICKVACWCIQDEETCRPSMKHVVQILEGVVEVKMPPIPRSVQILSGNPENIVFFKDTSSSWNSQVPRSNSSDSRNRSLQFTNSLMWG